MSNLKCLLALVLSSAALASSASSAPVQREEEPQGVFRWAMSAEDLGEVVLPRMEIAGWAVGPNGIFYRGVPSFSSDPTFEVIIRAPHSGHPLYAERLLIQIPTNFSQKPFPERAVMVAFHGFSVSEKDIFLNTDLPAQAAQRGWMLVAPYGLTDTSFANPQSQASLQAIFNVLYGVVPFNYRRVYGVGFSMGGLNALSYAMRHLDRQQMQFAGVVVHTSTLDMPKAFESSSPVMQWLLSNSRHFGGSPEQVPFEYERVSPVQFTDAGQVDAERAPVLNFAGRPIFLHTNLADSHVNLVEGMTSLGSFLQQRGANVVEHLTHDPVMGHHWGTLPLGIALDHVGSFVLGNAVDPSIQLFADNPGRWQHVDIESISPDTFGRLRLEIAPVAAGMLNSFSLLDTRDLDEQKRARNLLIRPRSATDPGSN